MHRRYIYMYLFGKTDVQLIFDTAKRIIELTFWLTWLIQYFESIVQLQWHYFIWQKYAFVLRIYYPMLRVSFFVLLNDRRHWTFYWHFTLMLLERNWMSYAYSFFLFFFLNVQSFIKYSLWNSLYHYCGKLIAIRSNVISYLCNQ